jgi:hypothetical protein
MMQMSSLEKLLRQFNIRVYKGTEAQQEMEKGEEMIVLYDLGGPQVIKGIPVDLFPVLMRVLSQPLLLG